MAKVVSVTNQKGGVGKTTTALNLAACLSRLKIKTLLLDMDPQANASSGLGVNSSDVKKSIYDLLVRKTNAEEVIIKTAFDGLDIIPSTQDLTGAEVELLEVEERNKILSQAIPSLKDQYSAIIIDCPPSLNILTINALTASDSVLMPIQCEYYALEGLSQLLKTIDLVRANINPALEIAGILLTMADLRTNLTRQVIDEVKKFFPDRVFQTIIPRSIRLSEAPSFGKPIIHYDENSIGAESYMKFANEFIQRVLHASSEVIVRK